MVLYLPETTFDVSRLGQCLKHSYVLPHNLEDSLSRLNFLEFKKRLPTEAVLAPSLEVPKTWLGNVLSSWL